MTEGRALAALGLLALLLGAPAAGDSLYHAQAYDALASDVVARRPGDVLTVLVFEDSSGSASASSGTDRSTQAQARAQGEITGVGGGEAAGKVEIAHEFAGEGSIKRSGRIIARVSVQVVEVLPNGDLVIDGTQQLVFNQETQSIVVKGQVRPYDIDPDNSIPSTRLSNATIEYTGDGILARAQRKSWLSWLLDWIF